MNQTHAISAQIKRPAGKLLNAALFGFLWAVIVVAAFMWHFLSSGWIVNEQMLTAAVPFALAAWISGILTALTTHYYGRRRSELRKFCTFLLLLLGLTLSLTVALFILHYRIYFATWHADFLSVQWSFQNFFTALAAVYLFLGTGLKVFLPWPLICAIGMSVVYARQDRSG
ncbi:MAG: hypothetical protein AAGI12_02500 [Pseudomonadota bacterium]